MGLAEFALRIIAAPFFGAVTVTIPRGRVLTAGPETTELGIGKTLAFRKDGEDGTTVVHGPSGCTIRFGVDGEEVVVEDRARNGHSVKVYEPGSDHTLSFPGQRIELNRRPGVIVVNEGPISNEGFPIFYKSKKKSV